jgi:hypothetical protein
MLEFHPVTRISNNLDPSKAANPHPEFHTVAVLLSYK